MLKLGISGATHLLPCTPSRSMQSQLYLHLKYSVLKAHKLKKEHYCQTYIDTQHTVGAKISLLELNQVAAILNIYML
jgi:hypothetical protein